MEVSKNDFVEQVANNCCIEANAPFYLIAFLSLIPLFFEVQAYLISLKQMDISDEEAIIIYSHSVSFLSCKETSFASARPHCISNGYLIGGNVTPKYLINSYKK